MLDDRQRDAGGVGLLEGVGADEVGADLAGDGYQGDRVHIGVGDAGDQVGRAGPAGGDADAHLARGAGIAVGRMHGALLVAHQDVAQPLGIEQGVVERDDHPAGEAEEHLAALGFQGGDDGLRTLHLHRDTAPFCKPFTVGRTGRPRPPGNGRRSGRHAS